MTTISPKISEQTTLASLDGDIPGMAYPPRAIETIIPKGSIAAIIPEIAFDGAKTSFTQSEINPSNTESMPKHPVDIVIKKKRGFVHQVAYFRSCTRTL